MSSAKICLSMIVRDESHVMDRCLKNCEAAVDAITIVDTGSLDNTVSIVEKYIHDKKVFGGIRCLPWRDFDRSRNDALNYSFETVRASFDLPLTGPLTKKQHDDTLAVRWYWFMHDADDGIISRDYDGTVTEKNLNKILVSNPADIKKALKESKPADQYILWITTGNCGFYYSRLFRLYPSGARAYRWHNPIHEVAYNEIGECKTEILNGVQVFSGKTGGRAKRGNKFVGDINVFMSSMAIGRIPPSSIARTLFYLGQSAMDCQFYDQAIYWYMERVKRQEGTYFERYVAHIRIAAIYPFCRSFINKEIPETMVKAQQLIHLNAAHNLSPHRREAAFELGKHHHDLKEYKIAWRYLKAGLEYSEPTVNDSFADMSLFTHRYLDLSYLCAYWADDKEAFVKYGKMVAEDKDAPEAVREKAKENLRTFAKLNIV